MKALTLWRPYPWAIFDLPEGQAKRIENRCWRPPKSIIGVPLALHAGRTFDHEGAAQIVRKLGRDVPPRHEYPEGIVGVVTVVDYLDVDDLWSAQRLRELPGQQRWFSGPFGWVLADVRRLRESIQCRGAQGLWTVPEKLERSILQQLATRRERR